VTDAFWRDVDAELARLPIAPELRELPDRSTEFSTCYAVKLTSIGPYRIFGYFSVPKDRQERVPGLLLTPRYGSVNHVPDYHDRARYAVLQLMHRGQRLADQPFAAAYPGLLTLGIERPETFIYRGIVADCLRGAEFLFARPEVDRTRVGLQGDDLALLTAGLRPGFKAVLASDLLLFRLLDAADRSDAYPAEELNDLLRTQPDRRAAVSDTLALFDPTRFVSGISSTVLVASGDAEWVAPLGCETYELTHHGAIDHDWLDAWMARQLGSEPRSRFLQVQLS